MVNRKGEQTKALILEKASKIFNSQGYRASSISDIMHETGLQKGGIYNHFENKEEIMLSAFSFSIDTMSHFSLKQWQANKDTWNAFIPLFPYLKGLLKENCSREVARL